MIWRCVYDVEPNVDESITSFDYMKSDQIYEKNQAINWQFLYYRQNQEQKTKAHHQ